MLFFIFTTFFGGTFIGNSHKAETSISHKNITINDLLRTGSKGKAYNNE